MPGGRDKIKLYFVIQACHANEESTSIEMKAAFSNAFDWSLKPQWIKEGDYAAIDSSLKGNVFVFEEFKGDSFRDFIDTYRNARVIGPKCLLKCFTEQIAIPKTKFPVYNLAMSGLLVSTSVKPADAEKKITDLIGYMGGDCINVLTTSTTHLVVSSIMSKKYFRANEEGIPVLRSEWVEDTWQQSLVGDTSIRANNEEFINEYKCPVFYKLMVTTSQLGENEKRRIKKIIEDGGGTYSSDLLQVTNILIIPVGRGEKYKFATRWNIKCVVPAWLEQCVTKGYAVRPDSFRVQPEKKCSTPLGSYNFAKMGNLVDTNDTDISAIPSDSVRVAVAETANFETQTQNEPVRRNDSDVFKTPVKNVSLNDKQCTSENPLSYQCTLNSIKLNDIKKCQHLLDGCKVYLTGFYANEEEKLRRILNYGGAIRFTDLNESVTHVIVGNPNSSEIEALKSVTNKPHIVKLEWLSSSIAKGCLERENNCAFFNENKETNNQSRISGIQQPSPLSKKGLQMLNPMRQIPVNTHPIVGVDQILIEKYASSVESENNAPLANVTSDSLHEEPRPNGSSSTDKLFDGLRFAIVGHSSSVTEDIKATLSEYGGIVVSNSHSVIDYTIVPFANIMSRVTSNEVVTLLWIEECVSSEAIVETKYYHSPVTVPDESNARPLNDCVITLSSYNNYEKQYLENVAVFLGARCQEVLSKKVNSEKKIAQTTHLVCSRAEGVKYTAAKRWNLPIVNKLWLLRCLSSASRLPVEDYAVTNEIEVNSSFLSSRVAHKHENVPCARLEQTKSPSVRETANMVRAVSSTRPSVANVNNDFVNHQSSLLQPNVSVRNSSSRSRNQLSSKLNAKPTPIEHTPVTTPSIAEAVHRSTQKNMTNPNQSHKSEASMKKNWPTGFLLKINARASSSVKRKLDCQPPDAEETPQDCPQNKLLRYENLSSSPYEEVGWQDTLTDLSNVQAERMGSAEKNDSDDLEQNKNHEIAAAVEKSIPQDRNKNENESVANITDKPTTNTIIHASVLKEKGSRKLGNICGNFLVSMPTTEKKAICEQTIKKLGGRVLSAFPTDCAELEKATHIIIDELKKTEKLLCSIASGIWVLHSSYLDRCAEAQKFLPEENFEWGNPQNERLLKKASKDFCLIARAAHRWRITISRGGLSSRPFMGMKAVIISTPNDEAVHSLTRVVKSGGGSVLPDCDILSSTHCLLKSPKLELIPVPLKQMADRKIHCLPAVYLSDYLMNNPPPDVRTCYLEPYKRLF